MATGRQNWRNQQPEIASSKLQQRFKHSLASFPAVGSSLRSNCNPLTVCRCLQLQSTARDAVAAEKLNFSVQLLSEQIENQNREIRELKAMIKERPTDDNDLSAQNLAKMLSDIEYLQESTIHLRYAASVVAAERSTVAGGERSLGSSAMSEAGIPLSTRRRNEVLGWIQEESVGDNTETEGSGRAPAIQRITSGVFVSLNLHINILAETYV
jgi:hypothetical protein